MDLLSYVITSDLEKLKKNLCFGDINQTDENKNSLLMRAIYQANLEIARLLVLNGANLNLKNKDGNTALHIAILKNNLALVKLLIRNKALIELKNNELETPLMLALRLGYKTSYELLLEFEPVLTNKNKRGESLGAYLIYANDLNLFKKNALKYDLLNERDYFNNTLLHLAVKLHRDDFTKVLLQLGLLPNVLNSNNETPLFFAAYTNNFKSASFLMHQMALLTFKNKDGFTIFDIASIRFMSYLEALENSYFYQRYLREFPLHVAVCERNKKNIAKYKTIINQNKKDDFDHLASFYANYYGIII